MLSSYKSIIKYIGEEKLQAFINFCMKYMSDLWIPFKRLFWIIYWLIKINQIKNISL